MVFGTNVCILRTSWTKNKGGTAEPCYLDFQRAFDSLNSRPRDQKAWALGMYVKVNNWITQSLRGIFHDESRGMLIGHRTAVR